MFAGSLGCGCETSEPSSVRMALEPHTFCQRVSVMSGAASVPIATRCRQQMRKSIEKPAGPALICVSYGPSHSVGIDGRITPNELVELGSCAVSGSWMATHTIAGDAWMHPAA